MPAIQRSPLAFARLDGRLDDPPADRGEHRVERHGKNLVSVTDQELQAIQLAFEVAGMDQLSGRTCSRCAPK
jgi:hypothetical protein